MSSKWGMASIILVMKSRDYPNKQVPLRQNDYWRINNSLHFSGIFLLTCKTLTLSFSLLQLSEWKKNDERLSLAVQENDLNKVDSLLLKKGVVPTKLDQQGTTLYVFSYLLFLSGFSNLEFF